MKDVHIVTAYPLALLLFIAVAPYRILTVQSLFADAVTGNQGAPEKNVLFESDLETQPLAAGWKREARGGDI